MGIGYLEFALKIQCVFNLPAFSMRFQRKFDKYKHMGGRVILIADIVPYDFDFCVDSASLATSFEKCNVIMTK